MQIVDVHTPSNSFSIAHSLQQDNLQSLFDKLSRKLNNAPGSRGGHRVNAGWLKYQHGDSFWNLDDDSDYTIFVWRHQTDAPPAANGAKSAVILHLSDPDAPLPTSSEFQNPSFYAFHARHANGVSGSGGSTKARSIKSNRSRRSRMSSFLNDEDPSDEEVPGGVPKFVKQFHRFHSENGVRTVKGNIGPVSDIRMLLKQGYRHVYVSRAFAKRNGFIPDDATPGLYGYTGLISIGEWPITLGKTTTRHTVYLSEESHFDVVLGRAFMERRSVKTDLVDMTNVICMDTGEKIDCEVVIIRDGKGEYVTVT